MAAGDGKFVLLNAGISVNGVDLSKDAHTVTVSDSAANLDATAFGGNGYVQELRGLKTATVTVEFYSDFAASATHATLYSLYNSGTTFALTILPDSTVGASATNPRGSMTAALYDYSPLAGQVGNVASFQATFRNAGSGLTWGTV